MNNLCCVVSPLVRCTGCNIDMCRTCGIDHVACLSASGWYVLNGDYAEAIRFARDASEGPIKLKTLYI